MLVPIVVVFYLISTRCNSSFPNGDENRDLQKGLADDNLKHVKYRLHKNQLSGAYYFYFSHREPGFEPEDRFVALVNKTGDTLKDLNEREFKYFFNYFVDDNYLFQTTDQHDFYEVYTHSIKDLPPGCYFDGSNYRIHKGRIEYYQNRGITLCNDRLINQARTLFPAVPNDFAVLDIKGYDCCVINQKIYCSGCLVEGDLDEKIQAAINEKRFKKKYCYPIKN